MRLPSMIPAVFLLPAAALAESAQVPDSSGSVLQMIFGLVLVLAMMVGGLWLLKRLTMPRGTAAGLMRVVAGAAVGPRERVVLVEVGSKWLVLGVAPGEVSMLAEVPPQDIPAAPADAGMDFAGWLRQVTERRHGSKR